jgi:hypothetical protein
MTASDKGVGKNVACLKCNNHFVIAFFNEFDFSRQNLLPAKIPFCYRSIRTYALALKGVSAIVVACLALLPIFIGTLPVVILLGMGGKSGSGFAAPHPPASESPSLGQLWGLAIMAMIGISYYGAITMLLLWVWMWVDYAQAMIATARSSLSKTRA